MRGSDSRNGTLFYLGTFVIYLIDISCLILYPASTQTQLRQDQIPQDTPLSVVRFVCVTVLATCKQIN